MLEIGRANTRRGHSLILQPYLPGGANVHAHLTAPTHRPNGIVSAVLQGSYVSHSSDTLHCATPFLPSNTPTWLSLAYLTQETKLLI